jgi:protein-S-isoprenylcysteine O-methyltransferase Ste14
MNDLELLGAPLAWLWLFIATQVCAAPALIRGLLRRGTGRRYEQNFWIQRAPQLAIATSLLLAIVAFEAIELRLGSGDPSFGHTLFEWLGAALPLVSLALVLPAGWATSIAWAGILVVLTGIVFLLGGLYALSGSFSTDAEVLYGHELKYGGFFRYVMHPMYSGFVQCLLGSALVSLSLPAFLFTAGITIPLLLRRARHEETLLRQEFGARYSELESAAHGRRLIPSFIPIGF